MQEFTIPDHVPASLVRDFNLYDFEGASSDLYGAWRRILETYPPVFYTPCFGGFWVLTRASLLEAAWIDDKVFSSAEAVGIPPTDNQSLPPMLPIETDDPLHKELRRPLNLALSPKAVAALSVQVRALAKELIQDLKPRGECDFVRDFSLKLPMEIFLRLVDLPSTDREYLIRLAHTVTKVGDAAKRSAATAEVVAYLDKTVSERTAQPGADLISIISQLEVDKRPLTHSERLGYITQLLFGGLDTVGGMMSLIAMHLAQHPDLRLRLIQNMSDIPAAVEELLRRYSIPTVGRRLTQDVVIDGVQMKAGDRVMLPTMAHGLDAIRWPNPLEVHPEQRDVRQHMAFGAGIHRCPGANLARSEIRIFLEEWLAAIPEFSIVANHSPVFITGAVAGLAALQLSWPVN
jgi:cytochrome P450